MVRLALYELIKLIAQNNVRCCTNDGLRGFDEIIERYVKAQIKSPIPRKLTEDKKPVTDWQPSTFQAEFDPYKNPGLI